MKSNVRQWKVDTTSSGGVSNAGGSKATRRHIDHQRKAKATSRQWRAEQKLKELEQALKGAK